MSFDVSWLDLREPADHAARDPGLARAFADLLPPKPRIIDLGSGTGSTVRALSPLIPDARWTLTDNDPDLLAEAKRRAPHVETRRIDLAENLEGALSAEADAITASALIDLVSEAWLDRLTHAAKGRPLYIALSHDGCNSWLPPHPDDQEICTAFDRHQQRDKGFGPALGARATEVLAAKLEGLGYTVSQAPSPWQLKSGNLINALTDGVARAAEEAGVSPQISRAWREARLSATDVEVGHLDLLAALN